MKFEDFCAMIVAVLGGAIGAYFNQLLWPFAALVLVMSVDYITGVHAAYVNGQLRSRVGLLGFLKKLSYIAIVVVGCVCDYLMTMLSGQLTGSTMSIRVVGLTMICWLIINELLSILENVQRIGGPVPPFIGPLLEHLQQATEAQAPVHEKPAEPPAEDPEKKEPENGER